MVTPFDRVVDLSKPIPQDLCKHVDFKKSTVSMGSKHPHRCIKCGRVEWR